MSDYLDYETSFDDYEDADALYPPRRYARQQPLVLKICRCGTVMMFVPDDDPNSTAYEWVCPYCDPDIITERGKD